MADSTPDARSLGQVGYEAAAAAVGMADKVTPYDELTDHAIAQWSAAASAIVVAYDASLFAKAEAEAQAMGLDPLPVPEPVGVGPAHEIHTLPDGTAFVGTAEEAKAAAEGVPGSEAKTGKGKAKA